MVTAEDIAELIWEALGRAERPPAWAPPPARSDESEVPKGKWGFLANAPYNRPYTSLRSKRVFLSEHEVRRRLADGRKELRIPKSAIVSPLAQEWLEAKGVRVIEE